MTLTITLTVQFNAHQITSEQIENRVLDALQPHVDGIEAISQKTEILKEPRS